MVRYCRQPYSNYAGMKETGAILLAAGRSRRMGAFKPLLPFGARSVAENCLTTLQTAGVGEIVVVVGHRAGEMRAHLAGWPVKFALNTETGSEMGVSIARGVEQLAPSVRAVFITLVDQPALPPAVLQELAAAWRAGAGPLLIPEYAGRGGHPVLISLAFRAELLNLDARRGLRGLFDAHRDQVRRVPVTSPHIYRDMDTWEDYHAWHEEIFGVPPPNQPKAP